MQNNFLNNENIESNLKVQEKQTIIKKICFDKETLRNLVTIASREHFDSKLKQDELISLMLDDIINSYYINYWEKNKPDLGNNKKY